MKIAVLLHKNSSKVKVDVYAVSQLAEHWRQDGHEVLFLFGTNKFVPADICIVHVDLSVVPEEYIAFAQQYPVALNSNVRDIRKSHFSKNILTQKNSYDKAVIVKSDLNYAGLPERVFEQTWLDKKLSNIRDKIPFYPKSFNNQKEYKIYDHLQEVPRKYFSHPDFVVEKFLPEKHNETYFVEMFYCLGNSRQCLRFASKDPIVTAATQISIKQVSPHQEVLGVRESMNLDYGKIDYCVHEGKFVLLDVNKTVGFGLPDTEEIQNLVAARAQGLYDYF